MKSGKKMNLAIIGFGRIAQKHFSAIRELQDSINLEAIVDLNPEVENFCKTESIDYFTNIDEMLANKNIDIGSICSPTGSHSNLTEKLANNKIHVLTEKPLATTYEDGRSMVESCKRNDVKLFTVKQFRNNPILRVIKTAIDEGSFGKIFMVNTNVYWTRPQAYYDSDPWRGTIEHDGGAIMNQASHFVDVLSWLMGDLEYTDCIAATLGRDIEVEDTAVANLKWKNGAVGSFNVTMLTYDRNLEGSLTILGEKGSVKISGVLLDELEHWNFDNDQGSFIEVDKLQSLSKASFQKKVSHRSVYENIIIDLSGKKTESITYGNEALKSLEMIIGMYKSSKTGTRQYFPIK